MFAAGGAALAKATVKTAHVASQLPSPHSSSPGGQGGTTTTRRTAAAAASPPPFTTEHVTSYGSAGSVGLDRSTGPAGPRALLMAPVRLPSTGSLAVQPGSTHAAPGAVVAFTVCVSTDPPPGSAASTPGRAGSVRSVSVGETAYRGGWKAGRAGAAGARAETREMQTQLVALTQEAHTTVAVAGDESEGHTKDGGAWARHGSVTDTVRVTGAADRPRPSVAV